MTEVQGVEELGFRKKVRSILNRVNVDRALVMILITGFVVVGWTSVNNSKNYHKFTECTVRYLVKDKAAREATTAASRKLTKANNEAFKTIPDFFGPLAAIASHPEKPATPKQTASLIAAASSISDKFAVSNGKYQNYLTAIKNNPPPPDPQKFCKKGKP